MRPGRKPANAEEVERARRLGATLRAAREPVMSRDALAARTGLAVGTIQRIEEGRTTDPGFFTIARIARELDLRLDDLADGSATTKRQS